MATALENRLRALEAKRGGATLPVLPFLCMGIDDEADASGTARAQKEAQEQGRRLLILRWLAPGEAAPNAGAGAG